MAAKKQKSSRKSSHGGHRPGAGRKPLDASILRAEIIAETDREICRNLPQLIKNMLYLANGGYERVEEKYEPPAVLVAGPDVPPGMGLPELALIERKVSIAEPDRAANQYLIDRVLGKPRQAVEMSGPEGGPMQVQDVTKMTDDQLYAILKDEGGGGT